MSVELLIGVRAIARFLKIGKSRVAALKEQGAPITKDDRGVLRAEKSALWGWFIKGPDA